MGCFGRTFKWWRKRSGNTTDPSQQQTPYGDRPHTTHDSITSGTSAFTDIEKAYIRDRVGDDKHGDRRPVAPLPSAANIQPNVHPKYSAYSGIAYNRGAGGSTYSRSRDWTGSQVSTQVSSRQSDLKLKDEGGVEDPEQEARRKKAEEIRRKFEEEEQERLDFFQMM